MTMTPPTIDLKTLVLQRARQLLSLGPAMVDELGLKAGKKMAEAMDTLSSANQTSRILGDISQQLVPLITALAPSERKNGWWQRFTGEALESQVMFQTHCRAIERMAEDGLNHRHQLMASIDHFAQEQATITQEVQALNIDIKAGQALMDARQQARLSNAGLDEIDRGRLHRRIGNLEAMLTSLELTQAQMEVSKQHARAALDRFDEIHALLLPIWKQRLGFELFASRLLPVDP